MALSVSEISRAAIEQAAEECPAVEDQVPMMQYLMHRNDPREGLKLTIDIADFSGSVTVAVMPYAGMKENDVVEVIFQAFVTAGQPIGRMPEMKKTLTAENIDKPVVFKLNRADLLEPKNLTGFYANFYFTVTPAEEKCRTSITQNVQVLSGSPTVERLATPYFEHDVGVVLYPDEHPDGVSVMAPTYAGQKKNDIVVLFDSRGEVVDFIFVTQAKPLKFTLGKAWLEQNANQSDLALQMQYGRANEGLRSLPLPLRVARKREFTDPPKVPGQLTFFNARAGVAVTLPPNTDIGGGTTTMYIVGADNTKLLETSVYKELNGEKVFTFEPGKLDAILGLKTKVYFTYTSSAGGSLSSKSADLEISLPGSSEKVNLPRLQCVEAQGIDKLPEPTNDGVNLELSGWPLMAEGQWVRVRLDNGRNSALIVNRRITEEEVTAKLVMMPVDKSYFAGRTFNFITTLYFNFPRKPVKYPHFLVIPEEPEDPDTGARGEIELDVLTLERLDSE
ncbi:hypothetical protein [Pseudomonas sp. PONIH3]|jgi:hypothetical protein|uniref:hypothetical protein n=1 Tax=Pseudomonas sp. PONIH3 TaxID=1636610 RepID=UPI001319F2C5|nr:hypothetical protein [Pseudomonas sp. PONIH3]